MSTESKTNQHVSVYELKGRPPLAVAVPLGLQHVFAMFIGNMAPILVMAGLVDIATGSPIITPEQRALMIQCCMLASGFATIIQLYPIKLGSVQIGSGLPVVMGTSFAFVPTMSSIGVAYGIGAVIGAVIVASCLEIFIGLMIKQLRKIFTPLVIGSVLLSVGLYLLPVGVTYLAGGANVQSAYITQQSLIALGQVVPAETSALASQYASWQNLLMGGVVFFTIVFMQRFAKGVLKVSAIVIGIAAGYILAIILGQVDFSAVTEATLVSVPIPFSIRPEFHLGPIITMGFMVIVSSIETIGHVNGMTMAVWDRPATNKETQGALLSDFAGNIIASCFNTLPNTSFGQNIGIVSMTKAVNKFCILITALVLVLAGLSPKLGALMSVMPASVLGGAVITVFAMIMLNGIKIIAKEGFSERNILIFVLTFGLGYSMASNTTLVNNLPPALAFIFSNSTIAVCLIAIMLNLIFPCPKEEKEVKD